MEAPPPPGKSGRGRLRFLGGRGIRGCPPLLRSLALGPRGSRTRPTSGRPASRPASTAKASLVVAAGRVEDGARPERPDSSRKAAGSPVRSQSQGSARPCPRMRRSRCPLTLAADQPHLLAVTVRNRMCLAGRCSRRCSPSGAWRGTFPLPPDAGREVSHSAMEPPTEFRYPSGVTCRPVASSAT